jgi:hypothetical protein
MISDIKPLYENAEKSYKCICDAFGCSKEATEELEVNAGTFGTISLSLCSVCIEKFESGDEKMKNSDHRKSLSLQIATGGQD